MPTKLITHAPGERFGRLVILERDYSPSPNKANNARWLCQCDCGNTTSAVGSSLRRGKTVSCGCRQRETGPEHNTKHGMADRIPEYYIWNTMRGRCMNPRNAKYPRYGGRGIRVCAAWNDFARFYADMGPRPTPRHSIDRIDNDGPYSPENCRWATISEQSNNRRSNLWLTHAGRTQRPAEWAAELGIDVKIIYRRMHRGWSDARVLTQNARGSHRSGGETVEDGMKLVGDSLEARSEIR